MQRGWVCDTRVVDDVERLGVAGETNSQRDHDQQRYDNELDDCEDWSHASDAGIKPRRVRASA